MTKLDPKTADMPDNAVDLSEALRLAGENDDTSRQLQAAVSEGITGQAKTFSTYSQGFAGRLIAEEKALRETVADIDAQIAKLQEQRTDAMLVHSMISHALGAAERGQN